MQNLLPSSLANTTENFQFHRVVPSISSAVHWHQYWPTGSLVPAVDSEEMARSKLGQFRLVAQRNSKRAFARQRTKQREVLRRNEHSFEQSF
jgi:hypothetical protein